MKKWILLFNISLLCFLPQINGWADDFEETPKITVKGEASVFKPADQMEVTLGVLTTAQNSSQALNENNQRMHQIVANLQTLGLDESDYQTGRFRIRPVYKKSDQEMQEPDHTTINFYEVSNNIHIKTQKIALADKIIGAAVQGGANQVEQVNFNLNSPQSYRAEAIQLATQNALEDAAALAKAANVKIKRILNLSLDQWFNSPSPLTFNRKLEGHSAQSTELQSQVQDAIEPGKAEIHAVVNVTLEIGS